MVVKNSNIKKEIKPLTIQKNNASIKIDDIGFIKASNNDSITWFGSDKIKVNKYFDEIKYDFEIEVPSNTNLFIRGLGFLYFKNSDKVSISNINKDNIIISSSFIGDYNGQD